jgi:hypothetical protein
MILQFLFSIYDYVLEKRRLNNKAKRESITSSEDKSMLLKNKQALLLNSNESKKSFAKRYSPIKKKNRRNLFKFGQKERITPEKESANKTPKRDVSILRKKYSCKDRQINLDFDSTEKADRKDRVIQMTSESPSKCKSVLELAKNISNSLERSENSPQRVSRRERQIRNSESKEKVKRENSAKSKLLNHS